MRATKEYNLANLHPDIAKEWHPAKNGNLKSTDVTPGSGEKVNWICKKRHEWEATVKNRRRGDRCPYCAGKLASRDHNLAVKYPNIAKQWHPTKNGNLKPTNVTPHSNGKVWWICRKGHEWKNSPNHRAKPRGCPYCTGQLPSKSHNLAAKYPDLAKQWHPTKNGKLKPTDVNPGTFKKAWWICVKRHDWEASVANRANGTGCPYCHPQTSKLEERIYYEFKTIFDDIKQQEQIDGVIGKCDIYIPKYKTVVKVDGYHWHKDKEKQDKLKGKQLLKKGITLFRLRENKLKRITRTDIFLEDIK